MFNNLISLYRANREQGNLLLLFVGLFLAIYLVPIGTERVDNALLEGFRLTNWYAREHVILCLVPAFIIAGAMSVYINQGAVLRYLGPDASKPVALESAPMAVAPPVSLFFPARPEALPPAQSFRSVVISGDEVHVVDAEPVDKVVDTTGAGDLYASGFLYGLTSGRDLATCARLGGMAAAEVISHYGARPEQSLKALAESKGL